MEKAILKTTGHQTDMTKIISAFPGTGKSYFVANSKQATRIIDLDTGDYTLGYTDSGKVRNPDFPDNYLRAVKGQTGKTDMLFVGCQPEVIAALRKAGLSFTLVYPQRKLKSAYLDRFYRRDNTQSFITLLANNWDVFLEFLENQKDCNHVVLTSGQYIGDILDSI